MIGIIGAMDVEVSEIKKKVTSPHTVSIAGIDFVCGEIENVMVCVAMCSAGKINAALCAQIMIDRFDVDSIINTGVGCSLSSDVIIKNVVIANEVCQYDIDVTALGEPRGFINGLGTVKIATDKAMSEGLARAAIKCGEKIHIGCITSGDTFISDNETKSFLNEHFNAICGEMEGGAVGQVCKANKIPFAVLRSISDGGDENVLMDYPTFKKIAANISTAIIIDYIKSQKVQYELDI